MRTILLATLLAGCAYAERSAVSPRAPIIDTTIHCDSRTDGPARDEIEIAAEEIRSLTDGAARLHLVWDLDEASVMRFASEPVLIRSSRLPPGIGGRVDGDVIRLQPERCPSLRACAMHEFGHFVGLEHVDARGAVMSERNPGARWTSADRAECLRVRLCGRPRDVTTVTVTVDPSIPNIDPAIPEWPHER